MDKREDVLQKEYRKFVDTSGVSSIYPPNFPAAYKDAAINAMDSYMKECVLLAFEFVAHETTGHSFNKTKDELEFKYKGEWITKEQLFENFL
jgi:hypothetical protein